MTEDRLVFPLDHPHTLAAAEQVTLLGGKAANLGVMARDLSLPVPPGFAITTVACRGYLACGWPGDLDEQLRTAMAQLESQLGRRFGDAADPLLVSVRSGAAVSMPGMMDTILDLGLNDDSARGLAGVTGDEAFATDCLHRFRQMFREIVGADPPDDPWSQLRLAVEAVFRSWNGERAAAYRAREAIPDDLGTGVTVQAMVFGNRGADSATGVAFTRNPATGEPGLYGDVLFNAQGEDVVAGTHHTEPIASLDARLPRVASELRRVADQLERHYHDLCDIEFTVERGRLWLLQVRVGKRSPRAALRMAIDMAEADGFPLSRAEAVERVAALLADPPRVGGSVGPDAEQIAQGLAASPGIASGEVAVTPDAAIRAADAGRSVILVRAETSPDDVHGMARARGILTASGGLASHAAVVARGWSIPAVVGARDIEVDAEGFRVGDRLVASGTTISIDGARGTVYLGAVDGGTEICPEATVLLGWARDLGIRISGGDDVADSVAAPTPIDPGHPGGSVDADALVAAIGVKGMATSESLAAALDAPPGPVSAAVAALERAGDVTTTAGAHRLTEHGRHRRAALLADERRVLGTDRATAALDGFLHLDRDVKETVTAWQLRPVDGESVPNDHTDIEYDSGVLRRLVEVHDGALAWFTTLTVDWPRGSDYARRLSLANERAQAGDGRYVASPRVDSYHSAWFELHEELIGLAGRTRESEVAAGRA